MANSLIKKALRPNGPESLDPEQIEEIAALARQISAILPRRRLTARQRQELGAWLFGTGVTFVNLTVRGMKEDPDLFSDIPIDPQELGDRNQRGERLTRLSVVLVLLAEKLRDQALRDRSTAIQDALAVVKQVRMEEMSPFGDRGRLRARKRALCLAEQVLAKRQKLNLKAEQHKKDAGGAQAAQKKDRTPLARGRKVPRTRSK